MSGRGRRQETGDRRQDKLEFIGGRSGRFVRMIFLPNYAPKIRSMHEHKEVKNLHCNSTPKIL
ncbi:MULTISPECIES: hypothetical protein [unclassified Okeania]|uniref:hypothetical protein n=1 Tax=unclassified Okeania TaxID=2634635 RepID=UPI0013BAD9B8|nr:MULTISPECIES: hypothetical protein [unclassified Okeania]NEP87752.1 hypothetical protein [Okeania sp. SIO2C2]NES74709.1 hypothetical protein [Okeania sp. SIO1H4]NET18431.1 hypothetical protein [Okeania sp. SIO1H5]